MSTVDADSMWRRVSVSAVLSSRDGVKRVAPSAQPKDNTALPEETAAEAVSGETHM